MVAEKDRTKELREKIASLKFRVEFLEGTAVLSIKSREAQDQILKACQEVGLVFGGDIFYILPNRYSHEVRVDDAYAQGFKDAQDKLFKARFRQTNEIKIP